jgi:hypothetical protein
MSQPTASTSENAPPVPTLTIAPRYFGTPKARLAPSLPLPTSCDWHHSINAIIATYLSKITSKANATPWPTTPPAFFIFLTLPPHTTYVKSIIKEQFLYLRPEHDVFVRSIGQPFEIENTTLIRHDAEGDEAETLGLLWQDCKDHLVAEKVVYLHTKGSFHPSEDNDKLRRFLTRGALSEECANLQSSCNVCSSRMAPSPHPHTPGNMWLATCDYVQKWINPLEFEEKMQQVWGSQAQALGSRTSCIGTGRFAAEHWIHSHTSSVMPCDLCKDKSYPWGYAGVPSYDFEIDLKPAPRFDFTTFGRVRGFGNMQHRGTCRTFAY